MTPEYVAGFLDADGDISIAKANRTYILRVNATNTHRPVLELLKAKYGGSTYIKHQSDWSQKLIFGWATSRRAAGLVLQDIEPFLIIKKPQAQLGLAFIHTFKLTRSGRLLTNDQLDERAWFHYEMSRLNQGGLF